MLKKIKEIKNVGVFEKYTNSLIEFGNLNLIYGSNASGKTTLIDIFKDLSESSFSRIEQRKTINKNGFTDKQFLKISSDRSYQEDIIYDNKIWHKNILKNKIQVFDTEFIQNNIFSGLELLQNRNVAENFYGFILGNEAVKKALEIENLKKELSCNRKLLKEKIPKSKIEKNDTEIKKYVEINIVESKQELEDEKNKLNKEKIEEENILKNINNIKNFDNISKISIKELSNFESLTSEIRALLNKTYSLSLKDIECYVKHIKNSFGNVKSEEIKSWIEKGVSYLNNSTQCPFCGQDITNIDLILKYKEIFDKNYINFSELIKKEVNRYKNKINNIILSNRLINSKLKYDEAVDLFGDKIKKYSKNIDKCIKEIEFLIENNSDKFNNEKNNLLKILDMKELYTNYNFTFDFVNLIKLNNSLLGFINEYNNIIDNVNKEINIIKDGVKNQDVEKITQLEKSISNIEFKLTRLKEDSECNEWKNQKSKIDNLLKDIESKNKDLENSQDEYLKKYFNSINDYFKKFDGRKFKIKQSKFANRGYKKTIGVSVEFNNYDISDSVKTSKIFSESDRRALALSIFMAKLENTPEDELENLIIVFDDPVTSLDSNRYTTIGKAIIDFSKKVKQIFILSHQYNFCKNMYDVYNNKTYGNIQEPMKYFEIKSENIYCSTIDILNAKKFFNNEFIKKYEKINNFIDGNCVDLTLNDLRIFMEEYLKVVFPKPHSEKIIPENLSLGEKINYLSKEDYINSLVKDELIKYKDILNSKSHNFDTCELRDKQNLAYEIVNYLDSTFRIRG